jgi:hypothetical protein
MTKPADPDQSAQLVISRKAVSIATRIPICQVGAVGELLPFGKRSLHTRFVAGKEVVTLELASLLLCLYVDPDERYSSCCW